MNNWKEHSNLIKEDAVQEVTANIIQKMESAASLQSMGSPSYSEMSGFYDDDGNYEEFATYGDTYGTDKPFGI